MKTIHVINTVLCILFTVFATAQISAIDTKNSTLNWTGKAAFNAYSLTGSIEVKEGQIILNQNTIEALDITIDMKSLDHENKDLKSHLRGKDFFEVKTYNTARFILTKPAVVKNGTAIITGQLTIKEQSKTETFTIKYEKDLNSLVFDITIDRTRYGITFNSPNFFKRMKDNAIADEFQLKGHLVF